MCSFWDQNLLFPIDVKNLEILKNSDWKLLKEALKTEHYSGSKNIRKIFPNVNRPRDRYWTFHTSQFKGPRPHYPPPPPKKKKNAGCGSSIGSMSAWHASGPEFDPYVGTFFRGDLVMKKFLRPFSLIRWFMKSSCQLQAKECAPSTG